MRDWLDPSAVLPVDELVFRSDVVVIGRFRCPIASKWFYDSGPIANQIVVFPRTHVRLRYAGQKAFASSPNIVTLYNRGQEYAREPIDARGDDCDWFAFAPDVLGEPFTRSWLPSPPATYARERALVESIATREDVEEVALTLLAELLDRPACKGDDERVEEAKRLLGQNLGAALPVRQVAERTGASLFHLCRIFRGATGYSMHEYRQQLRLRASLEPVAEGNDLLETALDFGFYGHSHFTQAFRRAFGLTPSEFRRQACRSRLPARLPR